MSEASVLMFADESSYKECKKQVIAHGGTIKNDLGDTLLGFTAVMPTNLLQSITQSSNLMAQGIVSIEPDNNTFHIQAQ